MEQQKIKTRDGCENKMSGKLCLFLSCVCISIGLYIYLEIGNIPLSELFISLGCIFFSFFLIFNLRGFGDRIHGD